MKEPTEQERIIWLEAALSAAVETIREQLAIIREMEPADRYLKWRRGKR